MRSDVSVKSPDASADCDNVNNATVRKSVQSCATTEVRPLAQRAPRVPVIKWNTCE